MGTPERNGQGHCGTEWFRVACRAAKSWNEIFDEEFCRYALSNNHSIFEREFGRKLKTITNCE